ncbi:MAG TPA: hypothetical protein VGS08_02485 [Candidatus Saccharimonadales bacterium]|nr:hypothetical protein [Candidatus Saccharimonadales bacterium]
MIPLAKRHIGNIRTFIVLALLLALPFLGSLQHASALSMNHADRNMHVSCATFCARANNAPSQQAILDQEETRAPDPVPGDSEPHYLQFQHPPAPRVLRPQEIFGSSSFRPPDLVTLYVNFRF